MFAILTRLFSIPELRAKIGLTLLLLAVYRLGFSIILPMVDQIQLKELAKSKDTLSQIMTMVSLFSASNIGQMTVFGLGIMPYISASILFQLLGTVYPPLERMQKEEGEAGRRKINEYTRYATVVICFFQSLFYVSYFLAPTDDSLQGKFLPGFGGIYMKLVATICMTAGSILLMWIGEQIDEFGVGNGISLLIMAGILARFPIAVQQLISPAIKAGVSIGSEAGVEKILSLILLFVVVVACVIFVTRAQRQIQINSAKHVRPGRVFGGQKQYLPIRINQSGVMPIIFGSSLLMFPLFISRQCAAAFSSVPYVGSFFAAVDTLVGNQSGIVYNLIYIAAIYFFSFFWSAVTFNPTEIANNLKDYGSFVPGYRPGARTAAYLESVMLRMTFVGAGFLSLIAVIPTLVCAVMKVDYNTASFLGGTGLLICVSVALDVVQKVDTQLIARNMPTILDKTGL